jgi:predicted transcriptional regulator of viral defense system
VVALSQIRALGLTASAVRERVAAGRLHRIHRGVYAVGHAALTREGHWLAAVLACGPGAVLSHQSAAALLDLRSTARRSIDVTAAGRAGRSRPGIDAHAAKTLAHADRTTVNGIPCTTVARTLLDLAEVVDRHSLARACERADALRLLDMRAVTAAVARATGRRGAARLRAILDDQDPSTLLTRSELERRFLDLCRLAGIARPAVNTRLQLHDAIIEVDFAWRDARLVVETAGHITHGTRRAFERDRDRDRRLVLAGWRVVRFTWRQVEHAEREILATLRALLP